MKAEDGSIVLTGFMGTGKSTIGQLVASRLQRPFLDMDAVLETRLNQPIVDFFATHGEEAFREQETQLCAELAQREGCVISTGGGTLVPSHNQALWATETHLLVCLWATPAQLTLRLQGDTQRPLLRGDWQQLYLEREAQYRKLPHHLDTDAKTPNQLVQEVVGLWQQHTGHDTTSPH